MWSGDAVDPMRALGEVRLGDVRGYEWRWTVLRTLTNHRSMQPVIMSARIHEFGGKIQHTCYPHSKSL